MKKRLLYITLLVFMLSIAAVHSEKTALYDKWTSSGESFDVGDFRLKATWSDNTVLLKIDEQTFSIPKGNCITSKPLEVCYNDSRITKDGKVVPDTIHDENVDHEMKLQVYGYLAKLEIQRDNDNAKILVSESSGVHVSIRNTGDYDASGVEYSETYPDSINITDVSGCDLDRNEITWEGTIAKGQMHACSYTITALEEDSFTVKASAQYDNGVKDDKTSVSMRLTIPEPPLDIIMEAGKTSLSPGDETGLLINLTNNEDTTIDVSSLKLAIPQGLELTDSGDLSKSGTWSGKLDGSKGFKVMLKAVRTGRYHVTASAAYEYDDKELKGSEEGTFNIRNDLEITLDGEISPMTAGEPSHVSLELFNPGTKPLEDIRCRITSDMPGFGTVTSTIPSLGKKNSQAVLDQELAVNSSGLYTINIDVTYRNEFSEAFTENFTRTVTVSAQKKQKADTIKTAGTSSGNESQNSTAGTGQSGPIEHLSIADNSSRKTGIFIIAGVIVLALLLLYARHLVRSK